MSRCDFVDVSQGSGLAERRPVDTLLIGNAARSVAARYKAGGDDTSPADYKYLVYRPDAAGYSLLPIATQAELTWRWSVPQQPPTICSAGSARRSSA